MDHGPSDTTQPVREAPAPTAPSVGPSLVLRPRRLLRLAFPTLVAAAALGTAVASPVWMLLVVPAALAALTWLPRLEVDGGEIRYRGIRTSATMPLTSVDAVQLRRVPFGLLHGPARTYRFGRFASTPIRVQVISGGEAPIWVTALWWQDWPLLVRFLMTVPYVAVDSRTRGRLERYG